MQRLVFVVCALFLVASPVSAQTASQGPPASIAVEADVLAFALPGYSGILNVSFRNGLQVAFGVGRYRLPGFLLEGDENFETAGWKATATSLQVFRATYRFRGPTRNGPAVGVVVLNQNMRLRADHLTGETKFRTLSVGISGGYYQHIGQHFYLYPTAAYTRNTLRSGSTTLQGVSYTVEKWSPNASLHAGWDWAWRR